VQLTILGSGSGGNSIYLEAGDTRLLIDAGFSGKQIRERLARIGRTPETLSGILITHEHTDHIQALGVLCPQFSLPVYCNRLTQEAIAGQIKKPFISHLFNTGDTFELGEVVVETFSIPHDAQDPVGFLIRTPSGNVGILTDLGHATKLVIQRVRPAQVLVLETNHDLQMLQNDTRRPWSLKQRILSRHGHLSNIAAADAAAEIVSADLRHLYLGHISRDCNRPELAFRVISERLQQIGANHVHVETTEQKNLNPTLTL
jgi:phosphoribosyl 1,2-cyclic phosphodiesterase